MHRMPRFVVLAVAASVAVGAAAACSSDTTSVSSDRAEPGTTATTRPIGGTMMATVPADELVTGDMLIGRQFVSTSVTGRDLVPGTVIGMSFDGTRLSATAGCGTIGGSYELAGGTITLGDDVVVSQVMCEDPRTAQDRWLLGSLRSGVAVRATPDGIVLDADGVTIELMEDAAGVGVVDGTSTPPLTTTDPAAGPG